MRRQVSTAYDNCYNQSKVIRGIPTKKSVGKKQTTCVSEVLGIYSETKWNF